MQKSDEYNDLFVDSDINKRALAESVKPFLKFTKEGKFVFEKEFYPLTIADKILVILLGQKILNDIGISKKESLNISELLKYMSIKKNSIEGIIYGQLKDVLTVNKGEFRIENYRVNAVIERLRRRINEK